MSLHLIELNDHKIRISQPSATAEILLESPGYANTINKAPVFGSEALQLSRLHPRHSYNQFWSQLSLDPLVNSTNNFRHQADLAYAHLSQLASSCDLNDEVMFAIPSHYNRNQLAILLGLVGQSPFKAVGLVDMALLNVANVIDESAIYIDIQLHQTVLTLISMRNGFLQREIVVPVAGNGLLALHDAWANMVTDAFIKQCRFDPQHNAETEQFVYNQLPRWLNNCVTDNEVLLEINNKGTIHQASLKLVDFQLRANNIYRKIEAELDTIVEPRTKILLSENMFSLPGLSQQIKGINAINNNSGLSNCFVYLEQIKRSPDQLGLTTSLALPTEKKMSSTDTANHKLNVESLPSHILLDHKAIALPAEALYLGSINSNKIISNDKIAFIEISQPHIQEAISIVRQGPEYLLHNPELTELRLNNKILTGDCLLQLGDVISFTNSATTLQLIQVQ